MPSRTLSERSPARVVLSPTLISYTQARDSIEWPLSYALQTGSIPTIHSISISVSAFRTGSLNKLLWFLAQISGLGHLRCSVSLCRCRNGWMNGVSLWLYVATRRGCARSRRSTSRRRLGTKRCLKRRSYLFARIHRLGRGGMRSSFWCS